MTSLETIKGRIERIIFSNNESHFAVFVLQTDRIAVTVSATTSALHVGQEVCVVGSWVMHQKFGKQFQATSCQPLLPSSAGGIERYLASGMIKGIGEQYAKKIVARFGTDTLNIIEQTPEKLSQVPGIGQKRIERIARAWQEQKEISAVMLFLQERAVPTTYAVRIYKQYKNQSISILTQNPYQIAQDIWGIGFKTADMIAQKMGIAPNAPARVKAGVLYALTVIATQGHLYQTVAAVKEMVTALLELSADDEPLIKQGLHELYTEQKICLHEHNQTHYIGLIQHYFCEKGLARIVATLVKHAPINRFNISSLYESLRVQQGPYALHEDQQRAILSCLQRKVSVITGGPGTGKTTLIKELITILEANHCTYKLAAPTGRAAKRMSEGTGRYAQTIHRMLDFNPSTMQFSHNAEHALQTDFLIVDEASMLDTFLAYALCKAVPHHAHVVFIGDVDQLPSVGPGSVLKDFIQSDLINYVRLTHIFRQAADSMIVHNAHRVNHGQFFETNSVGMKRDFIFIKEDDPVLLAERLKMLFTTNPVLKQYHDDIMVLAPMNRGVAGTQSINHFLQSLLNPKTDRQYVVAGVSFRVGDRVMQIKNNYDKKVFNGDIGTIMSIDHDDQTINIDIDGRTVVYDFLDMQEVVLAYAISIHKSQGSEYKVVIIPIFMQHFMLLQRNLIYTAITRAKKVCIIIGQPRAIAMAIRQNKTQERITFLKQFLQEQMMQP